VTDSLLDDARLRLWTALRHAQVSGDTLERLQFPKSTLKVSIPVRTDDGSLRTFRGYRARYDDSRGPTKAGSATTRTSTPTRSAPSRCG
jgi:glutamate dehydrogenase (NADP+)